VAEVIKILPEQIRHHHRTNKGSHISYKRYRKFGDNLKIFLDINKLLYDIDNDNNEKE
jgi:chemotaxis signal transduction protein